MVWAGLPAPSTLADHRHAQPVVRIAPDGLIHHDRCPALPRPCAMRQVFPLHLSSGDGAHQGLHRLPDLAHQHQARGVFVQPVHDARPRQAGRARVVGQQAVEQGPAPMPGRRMHDQPCRFVEHQQMLVFEDHVQRHGLGHKGHGLLCRTQLHPSRSPTWTLTEAFRGTAPSQQHRAIGHQLLQVRAGKLRDQGRQRTINSLAMHSHGNVVAPRLHLEQPPVRPARSGDSSSERRPPSI